MKTCPRCFRPIQDEERVSGVEVGDDNTAGLYDCGSCGEWFVVAADGSTTVAEFE